MSGVVKVMLEDVSAGLHISDRRPSYKNGDAHLKEISFPGRGI